ncbi:MAG: DUF3450 family protein [Opitutus sp.]
MLIETFTRIGDRSLKLTGTAALGLVLATLLLVRVNAAAPTEPALPVDAVRQVVTQWAKIRAETVKLESTWEAERELLSSTLKAEQERAQALVTQKKNLEAKSTGERETLASLTTQNATAEAALKSATDRLKAIGAQLLALRPSLPPRLSQALELPYRSLANPALTPGERMQLITTVLNRCAYFNKAITYGDEPMTLPGESVSRMLEVIYWGASHGYAFDRAAGKAYLGSPSATGWTWTAAPGAEKSVAQLIAIYRDKADPQFVEIPAHVSKSLQN